MKQLCLLFTCLLPLLLMAQPEIIRITPFLSHVPLDSRFEAKVEVQASYTNPYDYDQVHVGASLTGPSGQQVEIDGFYVKYYSMNSQGQLSYSTEGFGLRFTPDEMGRWLCEVKVTDNTGTSEGDTIVFDCVTPANPPAKGFVRTSGTNYLQFDNGDPFVLIGENMSWPVNNPYLDYTTWLSKLKAKGGNYIRLWHADWGLGIEWKNGAGNFEGLRRYEQMNAAFQDRLMEYCSQNGIYVMLCLQHHGQVSTEVNPQWKDNPYNAANGGPCDSTHQFFTHPQAIAHTQNRLRYIIARWGNNPNLMAWELFNEVDWTDNYAEHQADIMDWHATMAAFIKQLDPYQHLRTTSFAHDDNDPMVWANPDLDFTQTHYYLNVPNLERILKNGNIDYLNSYNKPTLNGEFGIGLSNTLATVDPDGIHIHNAIWGSIFSGGMGSAMSWWWDICIDSLGLYRHYEPLAMMTKRLNFVKEDLRVAEAEVLGASGDLSLNPSGGWGLIGEDTIFIDRDGNMVPAQPKMGTYLYGAQWNTQFRSPPVFMVEYPGAGKFSVRTSSTSGNSPKIAIWLDGNQVLLQNASTESTYQISIPAGKHSIKVDNPGKDWISISAYSFEGLGSTIDPYVLKAASEKKAIGWLLNNQYNHLTVPQGNVPPPSIGARLQLSNFVDDSYHIKWYNCLTGAMVESKPITVSGGQLIVDIPDLYWDMAFVVDDKVPLVASLEEEVEHVDFQLYPNPALAGGEIKIGLEQPVDRLAILDMNGREVLRKENFKGTLFLPAQLASGFYWVKVEGEGRAGVKPLVVTE